MVRGIPGWYDVRKNDRAQFMEQATRLTKDDFRKAMLDAVRRLSRKVTVCGLPVAC